MGSCGTSTRWHWNALKVLRQQDKRKEILQLQQRSTVGIGEAGESGEESTDDDDVQVAAGSKIAKEDDNEDDGEEVSEEDDGRPLSLLRAIGLSDLADKWPYAKPEDMVPVGAVVGGLSAEAASQLGLPAGLPVAQVRYDQL